VATDGTNHRPLATLRAQVERDETARRAMWIVWPLGLAVIAFVGRNQWFVADDWAFLLTRRKMHEVSGLDTMLLAPQDGHWMTWPILVFRLLQSVFGLGSYLPFLIVLWATHAGVVVLVRRWMARLEVSAWTSTLVSAALLVFGAGWENLFFAVQIVYNFSLLAFLAHTLLVDHDGPIDHRDYVGVGVSLIGVSSSGFGPFFGFGVCVLLLLRNRWKAALVAVVPQAVVWLWWWMAWGDEGATGGSGGGGLRFVLDFVEVGLRSALGSLLGTETLGAAAFIVCVAIAAWPGTGSARRVPVITLVATTLVMLAGVGSQREQYGVESAALSRYQYVVVMLLAPVLAIGLDQAGRFAPWARWLPRLLLLFAISRNVVWMSQRGDAWAAISNDDRRTFELVAGSPLAANVDPSTQMTFSSPDVRVGDLPRLIEQNAIEPEQPDTPEEEAIVRGALPALDPGMVTTP
jgi:hypothetical protein